MEIRRFGVILLGIAALWLAGCAPVPTAPGPDAPPGPDTPAARELPAASTPGGWVRHVEIEDVDFDFPAGWLTFEEYWPDYHYGRAYIDLGVTVLAGVIQPGTSTSATLAVRERPPTGALADLVAQTYAPIARQSFQAVAEREVTVNGQRGIEKVYRRPWGEPWYQVRDVWLETGARIYLLSCKAAPDQFDRAAPDFDLVVNSLRVGGPD